MGHITRVCVLAALAIVPTFTFAGPVTLPDDLVVDNGQSFTIPQNQQPQFKSITVGDAGGGTLVVPEFGPTSVVGPLRLGVQPAGSGTLTLQGGAGLDVSGPVTVGVAGTGSISVQSDARFLVTDFGRPGPLPRGVADTIIGAGASGIGTVQVDGTSASWQSDGSIIVGQGGPAGADGIVRNHGTLTITRTGRVGASADVVVAPNINGRGDVLIHGDSSLIAENLYVGGDATHAGGSGVVRLARDADVGINERVVIWPGGRVTLADLTPDLSRLIVSGHGIDVLGGTLDGVGHINANVTVSAGGTLRPDYFEMQGSEVTLESDSRFVVDMPGPAGIGWLGTQGGDIRINDALLQIHLDPANRTDPIPESGAGQRYAQILDGLHIFGHFANARFDGARVMSDDGFGSFRVNYVNLQSFGQEVQLSDFRPGPITAIPLPPAVWSGLATLVLTSCAAGARAGRLRG